MTLLEARPRLGGAASPSTGPASPSTPASTSSCAAHGEYLHLLRRLGADGAVDGPGTHGHPGAAPGRGGSPPASHSPACRRRCTCCARCSLLRRSRWRPARGRQGDGRAAPGRAPRPRDRPGAVRGLVRRRGAEHATVAALWGLVTVAALNIEVAEASLALAARVFRTGLLERADAGDVATSAGRSPRCTTRPADARWPRRASTCAPASGSPAWTATATATWSGPGTAQTRADAVVVAVPRTGTPRPSSPTTPAPTGTAGPGSVRLPIVNVHVRYRPAGHPAPVRRRPGLAGAVGLRPDPVAGCDGQYLAVSLSAADGLARRRPTSCCRRSCRGLEELFPAARSARVLDGFVTREPHATFRPGRRVGRRAPGPGDPLAGTRPGGRLDRRPAGRTPWRARSAAAARPPGCSARPVVPAFHAPRGARRDDHRPIQDPVPPPSRSSSRRSGSWSTEPMRDALDRLDEHTRKLCGYHLGYVGRRRQAGPGQAARGASGAGAALGPRRPAPPRERGVPAAVACELVHNFSLVHDDVMDGDVERRHRPTVWAVFGAPARRSSPATRCWRWPHEVLLEADAHGRARRSAADASTTRELIRGPGRADLAFERRDDVALEECLGMAGGKTGALLGVRRRARRGPGRRARPRSRRAGRVRRGTSGWPSSSSTTCWASGATRR